MLIFVVGWMLCGCAAWRIFEETVYKLFGNVTLGDRIISICISALGPAALVASIVSYCFNVGFDFGVDWNKKVR